MRFVIARYEALIFHGEKLNAFFAARRVNYKEVIYNLLQTTLPLKKIATLPLAMTGLCFGIVITRFLQTILLQ